MTNSQAPQPAQPKLEDIEQYRMQMAGISTAAIGYWKEGDSIHPDYDTVALRDVARLYAKYDALYKAAALAAPAPQAAQEQALRDLTADAEALGLYEATAPQAAPQSLLMKLAGIAAVCTDPDTTDALDRLIAEATHGIPAPKEPKA